MRVGVLSSEHAAVDPAGDPAARAERLARLELVRPGVSTAATMAHERTLPVLDGLRELVPSGMLQRGSTLAAHGPGATSFALAMSAEAVRAGSFLAIVAPSTFGLGTCLDFDIPLRRVVQFAIPETSGTSEGGAGWAQLVAAIVEGFDLVMLADRHRVTASQARQLTARNRERGSVLLRAGGRPWPDAPDLRYDLREPQWNGLGRGHGHLRSRRLVVQAAGRRWHGSSRVRHLLLPGDDGVEVVEPTVAARTATVTPLRSPTTSVAIDSPRRQAADRAERFAGADIDELLDSVDADPPEPDALGGGDAGDTAPTGGRRFGTVA